MSSIPAPRIIEAEFIAGAALIEQLPPVTGIEIAFAGRSNVGKSSLMNALAQRRKLVRTSGTPGCTRQVSIFRLLTAQKETVYMADLPGYGYAKRSKSERRQWADLIEAFLIDRVSLRAVAVLFDARRGPQEDEYELIRFINESPSRNRPAPPQVVLIATKLDTIKKSQQYSTIKAFEKELKGKVFHHSTEQPHTTEAVWKQLRYCAGLDIDPNKKIKGGDEAPPELILPNSSAKA